jgi:hypothetical protein
VGVDRFDLLDQVKKRIQLREHALLLGRGHLELGELADSRDFLQCQGHGQKR